MKKMRTFFQKMFFRTPEIMFGGFVRLAEKNFIRKFVIELLITLFANFVLVKNGLILKEPM